MAFTPYSSGRLSSQVPSDSGPTNATATDPAPESASSDEPNNQSTDPTSSSRDPSASSTSAAAALPPQALALASRLFDAARKGETEIFDQVLGRSKRVGDISNEKGDSLIMLASYHGHLPLVKLLLSHGADPNRLNERQQSPLAGVIFKGEDEIVEALLEAGADPRIGQPSAIEAVGIFSQQEKWGEKLKKAAEEAERRSGKLGNGVGKGGAIVDGDGDEIYEEAKVAIE